tara:strand:+ start:339 stop:932 length:594 start_codon:yes stop_codon:yes gene_type:complete
MLKELLKNRVTTKWWSDKQVEKDKLDYVLECIRRAPSKQLKYNFKVLVFDETKPCKDIKDWLYWEHTCCLNKIRGAKGKGLRRYNGQVLAPIVLAWASEKDDLEVIEDIMVSSTTALLSAEEVGLNTGFNGCLEPKELGQKVGEPYVHMLLGLGYADKIDGEPMRKVYKDGIEMGFDLSNGAQGECINNTIGEYYGR